MRCCPCTPCTSHSLTSGVDPPNPAVCLVQVPLKKGFSLMNWIDKTNKMGGGSGGNKRPTPVTNACACIPSSSPRATHRNPQRQHHTQHNTTHNASITPNTIHRNAPHHTASQHITFTSHHITFTHHNKWAVSHRSTCHHSHISLAHPLTPSSQRAHKRASHRSTCPHSHISLAHPLTSELTASSQVGITPLDMSSLTYFTCTSPHPELTASSQVGITPLDMSSLAQFTCMNI